MALIHLHDYEREAYKKLNNRTLEFFNNEAGKENTRVLNSRSFKRYTLEQAISAGIFLKEYFLIGHLSFTQISSSHYLL